MNLIKNMKSQNKKYWQWAKEKNITTNSLTSGVHLKVKPRNLVKSKD